MKDKTATEVSLRILDADVARRMRQDAMAEQMPKVGGLSKQQVKINREKQAQPDRIFQQNSVHKLEALIPVRVATSKVLEGEWQGRELTAVRVVGSVFGGPHYILQLGYETQVGYAASFRLVFVAHLPLDKGKTLTDPAVIEEAKQTATAFMYMLNMRRKEPPLATSQAANELAGKRADLLLIDELKELDDLNLPGTRPSLK